MFEVVTEGNLSLYDTVSLSGMTHTAKEVDGM
jgi:hypothetical protein